MSKYCEALEDFIFEFFKVDRYKGSPEYDKALKTLVLAFSFNVSYDGLVVYMIDNNIPLKANNIIKLIQGEGIKPVSFNNEEQEYNFICRNIFKFLVGLMGIPRIKNKRDRFKVVSLLASVLSVDTNWSAVWTLFLSRGRYSLKSLVEIVLDVVADEMNIPLGKFIRAIKTKKVSNGKYTLVLKVNKDYIKHIDAKTHSKLKEKLGEILIEL